MVRVRETDTAISLPLCLSRWGGDAVGVIMPELGWSIAPSFEATAETLLLGLEASVSPSVLLSAVSE